MRWRMRARRGGAAWACAPPGAAPLACPAYGGVSSAVFGVELDVGSAGAVWFRCAASGMGILRWFDVVGAGAGGSGPVLRSEAADPFTGAHRSAHRLGLRARPQPRTSRAPPPIPTPSSALRPASALATPTRDHQAQICANNLAQFCAK